MSDKIRKLSQALRLGATFRPQCRGAYFAYGKSCSIGAIREAISPESPMTIDLYNRFPELYTRRTDSGFLIESEIICRNDGVNGREPQTREEIADWLASIGL